MTGFKGRAGLRRLLPLLVMLALVVPAVTLSTAPETAHSQDDGWQEVVVLYTSDIKGKIDPCG